MFTGIIEAVGTVGSVEELRDGRRLTVNWPDVAAQLVAGESVAIDGVCQTVVSKAADEFVVEAIGTTLSRTTFAEFEAGRRVNLERAAMLGARLGGHLVQGHVDAVGRVAAIVPQGEHVLVDVELPEPVADVTVLHGSIAINGVSLTVNALSAEGLVQVALIPFTWQHTNLRELTAGDRVNLEGDMFGRFVVAYLKRAGTAGVLPAD